MIRYLKSLFLIVLFNLIAFYSYALDIDTLKASIPLGGNAWVNQGSAQIKNEGLLNWTTPTSTIDIFFRVNEVATLQMALYLKVPDGESTIRGSVNGKTFTIRVSNRQYEIIQLGQINVTKAGYVKLTLQGLNKTGTEFAQINDLVISGFHNDSLLSFVKNNNNNYFHWGRRGPSVHLNYVVPEIVKSKVSWFYSEVTVPEGMDPVGSYFQANGFNQGYFGIQVNSLQERRILFSVWSPFEGNDPKSIPDSMKIVLLEKGKNVHTGEFGNEGTGGQSYSKYAWKAGQKYAFLIHAEPDSLKHKTIFTAWFNDLSVNSWHLIARFQRPQTVSYFRGLYSFNENFIPEAGNRQRIAFFGNQWVADNGGNWYPVNEAIFTGDDTAGKGYRMDYAGGVIAHQFYLKNGGFFDDFVPLKKRLSKSASRDHEPKIDLLRLSK